MAQQGLFGEILHVEGAYIHNLEEFGFTIGTTGGWTITVLSVVIFMPPMAWDQPVSYLTFTVVTI